MLTIPLKISMKNWINLPYITPKFFPEGTSTNDIVPLDDSFTSTESLTTDDAILCDVLGEKGSETEDDKDVSNEPICPRSNDVRQTLDVLREYMLFSENGEFIH